MKLRIFGQVLRKANIEPVVRHCVLVNWLLYVACQQCLFIQKPTYTHSSSADVIYELPSYLGPPNRVIIGGTSVYYEHLDTASLLASYAALNKLL